VLVDDALIVFREEEKGPQGLLRNLGRKAVEPITVCGGEKTDGHGGLLSANVRF
jgi:hypothetical protein